MATTLDSANDRRSIERLKPLLWKLTTQDRESRRYDKQLKKENVKND